MAVMSFSSVRKVENHGVIEHSSVTFRNTFKPTHNSIHQSHMMSAAPFANLRRFHSCDRFTMANIMHIDRCTFDSWNPCIAMPQFIHGKRDNIGQS